MQMQMQHNTTRLEQTQHSTTQLEQTQHTIEARLRSLCRKDSRCDRGMYVPVDVMESDRSRRSTDASMSSMTSCCAIASASSSTVVLDVDKTARVQQAK